MRTYAGVADGIIRAYTYMYMYIYIRMHISARQGSARLNARLAAEKGDERSGG